MMLNIIFPFPQNTPFSLRHFYPNVLNKRILFPTNMASTVMAILKATVGKLLDKGRKMVADRLKEGDVTDEQFRTLIVGEIDEIKSKLDGIARANLLAERVSAFSRKAFYTSTKY